MMNVMSSAGLTKRELGRLYESDCPIMAVEFSRSAAAGEWAPPHTHVRGQILALTTGLLMVDAAGVRWMFPSQCCAWIPPNCVHSARSLGGASGSMLFLSPSLCRGLPAEPRLLSSSDLLFALANRILSWNYSEPVSRTQM